MLRHVAAESLPVGWIENPLVEALQFADRTIFQWLGTSTSRELGIVYCLSQLLEHPKGAFQSHCLGVGA
jgi:hypothetical protein